MSDTQLERVRWAPVVVGLVGALLIGLVDSPLHHDPTHGARPAAAAAVTFLMAAWWLTEAVPIQWTALVPLVAFPWLGLAAGGPVEGLIAAAKPYVDAYTFLFLGGMCVAAAMQQWGLHRRIAVRIMATVGTDPKRLLLGVLGGTGFVSMWISNTATAAMMLPIALALVLELERQSGGRRLVHYGAAVMLAVAYGANIGGIGTKIGTAPNAQFAQFMAGVGVDVGFLQFMAVGLPFVLMLLPIAWLLLWRDARRDAPDAAAGERQHPQSLGRHGGRLRLSVGEGMAGVVAQRQHRLWCALDAGEAARGGIVERGREPVLGLERHRIELRELRQERLPFESELRAERQQRDVDGVAPPGPCAVPPVERRLVAEHGARRQFAKPCAVLRAAVVEHAAVGREPLAGDGNAVRPDSVPGDGPRGGLRQLDDGDRELVAGERSRFVARDHGAAAEALHRLQAAHDHAPGGHSGGGDRQGHRERHRQPLGDHRHGEGDGEEDEDEEGEPEPEPEPPAPPPPQLKQLRPQGRQGHVLDVAAALVGVVEGPLPFCLS